MFDEIQSSLIKEYGKFYNKHPRGAGLIVIYKDISPMVLIVKHRRGTWSFPKGGIEDRETVVTAAYREFSEETNLPLSPLSITEYYYDESYTGTRYIVAEWHEPIETQPWTPTDEGGSTIMAQWIRTDCTNLHPNRKILLKKAVEQLYS